MQESSHRTPAPGTTTPESITTLPTVVTCTRDSATTAHVTGAHPATDTRPVTDALPETGARLSARRVTETATACTTVSASATPRTSRLVDEARHLLHARLGLGRVRCIAVHLEVPAPANWRRRPTCRGLAVGLGPADRPRVGRCPASRTPVLGVAVWATSPLAVTNERMRIAAMLTLVLLVAIEAHRLPT